MTFEQITAEALDLHAKNGSLVDPHQAAAVKRVFVERPSWCEDVLLRRVEAGRFGPKLYGAELELLYVANEKGWTP